MAFQSTWSREEHIIAFNLYCQIPFGKMHSRNPKVQAIASILGRSPGSVARKLGNFARLDPFLQQRGIKGLQHGAKGEEEIWNEFYSNPEALAFESENLLAKRVGKPVEQLADVEVDDLPVVGKERDAVVRVRVNQSFFRRRVLSLYQFRCCVTGLSVQPLLVASHIIPWALDAENRLNPRNGLCLNALHDRAFDCGLMWVEDDFVVRFSPQLFKENSLWLTSFEGQRLLLPPNFQPDCELLKNTRLNALFKTIFCLLVARWREATCQSFTDDFVFAGPERNSSSRSEMQFRLASQR